MPMHYSNPRRETDPHALPDVEVFYRREGETTWTAEDGEQIDNGPGWYYWFCLPGCLPDSDPMGPFDSESAALADARAQADDDSDNDE